MEEQYDAGFIYAIEALGTSLVKIGCTKNNVERRLVALQTGHPYFLKICAVYPVDKDMWRIERYIHDVLQSDRHHGEWFAVSMDTPHLAALVGRAITHLVALDTQSTFLPYPCNERQKIPNSYAVSYGLCIRRLRKLQRITGTELAARLGVDQTTISRLETGRTVLSLEMAEAIARVLNVHLCTLAGHEHEASAST